MASIITQLQPSREHQVVYFALCPGIEPVIRNSSISVCTYQNHTDYRKNAIGPHCFVIGSDDGQKAFDLAKILRSQADTALKPIFLLASNGPAAEQLCDGVVQSIDEAVEKAAAINHRLQELDPEYLDGQDGVIQRLLGWLYSRQAGMLTPLVDWRSETYYRFPIIEAMGDEQSGSGMPQALVDRHLLAPVRLIDRIRQCPKCSSAHLNYIDVCPECGGINIVNKPFLHCFACGHVAPEDNYLTQGTLVCPKCATYLRHIGSDYDRPLENFQCDECSHIFIEPTVSCRCMQCTSVCTPDELIPKPIYSYELSQRGRISAQTGFIEDVFSMFDSLNNVNAAYFESIVDWLLSLCRRHSEEQFSLIVVRMKNLVELTEQLGRQKIRDMLDEFARRVRELIRSTDLTTRTNQYTLWILLPKTHDAGNHVVLQRISEIKTVAESGLELGMISFHAPSQTIKNETAKLLMARLQGEVME